MTPSEGLTLPRSIELPADTIGFPIVNAPGKYGEAATRHRAGLIVALCSTMTDSLS
jgi:hypothetical protein